MIIEKKNQIYFVCLYLLHLLPAIRVNRRSGGKFFKIRARYFSHVVCVGRFSKDFFKEMEAEEMSGKTRGSVADVLLWVSVL